MQPTVLAAGTCGQNVLPKQTHKRALSEHDSENDQRVQKKARHRGPKAKVRTLWRSDWTSLTYVKREDAPQALHVVLYKSAKDWKPWKNILYTRSSNGDVDLVELGRKFDLGKQCRVSTISQQTLPTTQSSDAAYRSSIRGIGGYFTNIKRESWKPMT